MAQISCFSPGVTGAEGEAHLQRSQGCQRLLSLHRQRPGFEKSSRILEGRPRRCQSAVVFWWFWCRYIYHFSAYLLDLQHIYIYIYWLVVSNIAFIFPYIGNVMIPTDELIFFRGVAQPPTRMCLGIEKRWIWKGSSLTVIVGLKQGTIVAMVGIWNDDKNERT